MVAIGHYQDALRVNPQYASAWFRCDLPNPYHPLADLSVGCCAMVTDQFTLAQQAFSRCVQLSPDDGEAWNNLASVYLKSGKKLLLHLLRLISLSRKEAAKSYKEALKQKNSDWRIWENFLVLSMVLLALAARILISGNERIFRRCPCFRRNS